MQIKVPFLDLKAQHAPLLPEINAAIAEVIDSGAFAGGPFVTDFEADFAKYCNAAYSIGVASGTDALWLCLLAWGIGPGDEVITVPSSFMATAEAISYTGATPVFVDIDELTYNMDPSLLEAAISPRTKAIVPVHLFGQAADMDPIVKIARAHGLFVLEDASQAHGAGYKGRRAGTLGDAAAFSFYPGKNLGAFGEAGAVVTNDPELQQKIRIFRDHGQVKKYYHSYVGWNGRMDGIQGAVLRIKLRHLEAANQQRRAVAGWYDYALAGSDRIAAPLEADYANHVYHIYAVRVQDRDQVRDDLAERGIGSAIHYPVPIHLQEAYRNLGMGVGSFPVAEKCANEFLSLPMFPGLREEQVAEVVQTLEEIVPGAIAV